MLSKIIIRGFILTIFIIVANYTYKFYFLELDLQKHSEIINLVRAVPNDADIIYIGESSNTTFSKTDLDKRKISDFVGDHFPSLNVYDISKPAAHAGIYKVLLENVPIQNNVKTVVVTLNLRSFNSGWINSKLETPLQKSTVLLKSYPPLWNRFMLSFKNYDIQSLKERNVQVHKSWQEDSLIFPYKFEHHNISSWNSCIAKKGVRNDKGEKDIRQTQVACNYVKNFGFQIDTTSNLRIKNFDEIIILAQKRGWNLVFNLLPENTERAEELVGKELTFLMNQNAKLLKDYFTKKGVLITDNFNTIKHKNFRDKNQTTEHYLEVGRKKIAGKVAKTCAIFHPKQYQKINYSSYFTTHFFNDCESKSIWGQKKTITTEDAYSGKHSSKVDINNNYSISLNTPLKKVPDSLKNNVSIEFKAKITNKNGKQKLIIQAIKNKSNILWKSIKLDTQINRIGEWKNFKYIFCTPDHIKNADEFKIYVLSKAESPTYIDDFKVVFY